MKKSSPVLLDKLSVVKDLMPTENVLSFFENLVQAHREQMATTQEIARIDAARECALAAIGSKYALLHKVFDRVFEERAHAIDKHFQIIEKGLKRNDRELILGGLRGLSEIVSSSPFGNVEQLGKLLESGTKIEF